MSQERTVTIAADSLIRDSFSPVLNDVAVCISGGRIVEVGKRNDAERIDLDLGARTLSPGLFDMHVHLHKRPEGGGPQPHHESEHEQILQTVRNSSRLLANGVTSVRDLGSPGTVVSWVRDAIASGSIQGPRIQTANQVVTITGGHGAAFGMECDDNSSLRTAVRQHMKQGSDWIKIMASGGFSNPYRMEGETPFHPLFDLDEMKLIVAEAQRFGIPATAHCQAGSAIANAFEAGVETIEHASFAAQPVAVVDQDLARAIGAAGVPVVPTTNNYWLEHGVPWAPLDVALANLKLLFDCGINLLSGTDMGLPTTTPETFASGLIVMDAAGIPPDHIHAGATVDSARTLNMGDELGRIAPGCLADMVAFDGNPLDDVYAYGRVDWVMSRGVPAPVRPDRVVASPEPERAAWSGVHIFGDEN